MRIRMAMPPGEMTRPALFGGIAHHDLNELRDEDGGSKEREAEHEHQARRRR
jgi:hypothetical protein